MMKGKRKMSENIRTMMPLKAMPKRMSKMMGAGGQLPKAKSALASALESKIMKKKGNAERKEVSGRWGKMSK